MKSKILNTSDRPEIILIRLMTGLVFFSEGIQKFLFASTLGVGRFIKIGLPIPEVLAPLAGATEIIFGALLIIGLFTRPAVIPLLIVILVAIISTKIPILLNKGLWAAAHEARTDFSMLLGLIFLLISGGGRWSVDRYINRQNILTSD
jgi:putative oxidoreductase